MSRQRSLGRQKIADCVAELGRLAQAANGSGPLIRGSFYTYRRRCGKIGCRCAHGRLHLGRAFSVSTGGRSRVMSLRGLDRDEVEAGVKAWRQWRQTRAGMVAAFGEGTEECARWYDRLKEKLWLGEIDAILRALEKESQRVGKPAPKEPEGSPRVVLHRNLGYFANNREGMNYPRFRAEGWPIGSGIAEGAVKQFGMRMKGTEKFWNGFGFGNGAEEMLALCALHRSEDGRWRTYWDRRARPYTREPRVKSG